MHYGLLGRNLSHSYSPQIHNAFASYSYELMQIEPDELEAFMQKGDFKGINVTIPYKKAVVPYCHTLSPQAKRLGTVNTIVKQADGTLWGHNTDYFGFQEMIHHSALTVCGKKVLVLGSGGAGVTACAVLTDLGADVVDISRQGANNYENLHLHEDASIIVNATPVGMFPNNGLSPVSLSAFSKLEGVLDLIYNPSKTELLLQAEQRGLPAVNGLYMLVAQAKESAECFIGSQIPDRRITEIYTDLKMQMENIILIGMPGSGKSTIGQFIAGALHRQFIDTDTLITERTGMSIPAYMEKYGIGLFRQEETAVLRMVCKQSGLVIATGGGCVTREENARLLHQNGTVIWIDRNIEDLPTEGRPLSVKGNLRAMFDEREPLYASYSDLRTYNNDTPEKTAERILEALKGD